MTLSVTQIDGGTINNGDIANSGAGGGNIVVSGNSTIDSSAVLNDGTVTVNDGVLLTLNGITVNASTITDDDTHTGSGQLTLAGLVKLKGGAVIDSFASGNFTNTGTLEIVDTATLSNDTLTNLSLIHI